MTATENARPGEVSSSPSPGRESTIAAAHGALTAVLTAPTSVAQLRAYADLEARLTDRRAAVWDGVCNRVSPVGAWFSRCMRHDLAELHTVENQRWATADDLVLASRWPLIEACWSGDRE